MRVFGIEISFGKDTEAVCLPINEGMLGKNENGIDMLAQRAERLLKEPSGFPGLLDIGLVGRPIRLRILFDKGQTDSASVTSWAIRVGLAELNSNLPPEDNHKKAST